MRNRIRWIWTLAMIALVVLPPVSSAQEKRPAADRSQALAGFHVVLLVGEDKDTPALGDAKPVGEGLTPAITTALRDVQQFLPYKSYRVWDTTFIRGDSGSTSLKAPNNQIYVVNINSNSQTAAARSAGGVAAHDGYWVRLILTPSDSPATKDAPAPRRVLDTGFQMDVGETIVAGTSRQPRFGTALVMVVSALPASALKH